MTYQATKTGRNIKIQTIKWKKPIWEGSKQYNSDYPISWKRQKFGDSKKTRLPRVVGGRDREAEHRAALGQWKCYADTTMTDTCHDVFVKTHRTYNANREF